MSLLSKRNQLVQQLRENYNITLESIIDINDVEMLDFFIIICSIQILEERKHLFEEQISVLENDIMKKQNKLKKIKDFYKKQDIESDIEILEINKSIEIENLQVIEKELQTEIKDYEYFIQEPHISSQSNNIRNFLNELENVDYDSLGEINKILKKIYEITNNLFEFYPLHKSFRKHSLYEPKILSLLKKFK